MKNNLENIIRENKEFFNDSEPMEDHFKRFEAILDKEFGHKKNKFSWKIIGQIAAAVVFIFLAVNQAFIYFSPKPEPEISLSSIHPEYSELEMYYTSSINAGLSNWSSMQKNGELSEEEQQLLNQELEEFKETFKNLQEELKANPDDERVINAMIEFYQSKLNVITIILDNMQKVKQLKNTKNGTEI